MKKKLVSLCLALVFVLGLVPAGAFGAGIKASGECGDDGDNIAWTLDSDGVLTLSGNGDMQSMAWSNPWDSSFNRETDVTKLVVGDGITSIGTEGFQRFRSLHEVKLPNSLRSIGDCAFNLCDLYSVDIPDQVQTIGALAFSCNTNLDDVRMGKYVRDIGEGAFQMCHLDNGIELPEGLTKIRRDTFYGCDFTSVVIPEGVTSIEQNAFESCSYLVGVKLPDTLETIGQGAFEDCESLTSVKIPNRVTELPDRTFYECESLKEITLPQGLSKVQENAFKECYALKDVYFLGVPAQWESLRVYALSSGGNRPLVNASVHYYTGGGDKEVFYPAAAGTLDGHRYRVYKVKLTYDEALAFCQEYGGRLPVITSEKENDFVTDLMAQAGVTDCWLGLLCQGSLWSWTGSEKKAGYTDWADGQPAGGDGKAGAVTKISGSYYWKTEDKTATLAVVTEQVQTLTVNYRLNYRDDDKDIRPWTVYESETVDADETLIEPFAPRRDGYKFCGWYPNEACQGDPWGFKKDPVTANLNLYAKWENFNFVFERDRVRYGNGKQGDLGDYTVKNCISSDLYGAVLSERSSVGAFLKTLAVYTNDTKAGLCFGTSSLMALNYYGLIDLSSLGYSSIRELRQPKDDPELMSLICSLYMLQSSENVWSYGKITKAFEKALSLNQEVHYSKTDLWKETLAQLDQGRPVMISMLYPDNIHHQVLAYKYDTIYEYVDENLVEEYSIQIANPNFLNFNDEEAKHQYILWSDYTFRQERGNNSVVNDTYGADIGAILYDYSPLTQYGVDYVRKAESSAFLQSVETASLQEAEEAEALLSADYSDFTVQTGDGTAVSASDLTVETVDGFGTLYALPASDGGWTVTPGPSVTAGTVRTEFLQTTGGTGLLSVAVTCTPAASVSLDAGGVTVSAAGALGTVTATLSDFWNRTERTVNYLRDASLRITWNDGQLNLTYGTRTTTDYRDHSVFYDTGGGTAVAPVTGLDYWASIPVPDEIPIRTGYRFDGWSLADGILVPVPEDAIVKGKDVTLYAFWTECSDREVRFTVGEETQTARVKYNACIPSGAVPTAESFGLEEEIVWDQDALARLDGRITEDVTVTGSVQPKADGTEASVPEADIEEGAVVRNDSDRNLAVLLMAAYYDENGRMLQTEQKDLTLPAKQSRIVSLNAPAEAASVKVMLLRSGDFVPLGAAGADARADAS